MTGQAYLIEEGGPVAPAGDGRRFGGRWRLVGAGLSNVWRYGDLQLPAASGRLLLRGPNGTGKTTALEALWPFLLDLDRTKLRAGQSRTTTLTSLMREGHAERKRIGYAWLTFAGPGEEGVSSWGARLVFSNGSTPTVRVEPFTVPGEPLVDLPLTGPGRTTITTADAFRDLVEGAGGVVFGSEEDYLTALGNRVFQTARSDLIVLAERVRKVRNPSLLATTSADEAARALREALPGVSNDVIEATGQALASTDETRAAFQRDVDAAATLGGFAEVWAGHAADVAGRVAESAGEAQAELTKANRYRDERNAAHEEALRAAASAGDDLDRAEEDQLAAQAEIDAITKSPAYATIGRLADLRASADAQERAASARIDALERQADHLRRGVATVAEDTTALAESVAATGAGVCELDQHVAGLPTLAMTTRPQPVLAVAGRAFDPGPSAHLVPAPDALTGAVRGWRARASMHDDRAAAADLMLREHRRVAAAAEDAAHKAARADEDERAADDAARDCDRMTDQALDVSRRYAAELSAWAADHPDLTATADSDPLDAAGIDEVAANGPAALLAAAGEWSLLARGQAETAAARRAAEVEVRVAQAAALRGQAGEARADAAALRTGRVIPPPRPDWAGPTSDDAFANAVDWLDETGLQADDTTRALVESALASSGVLGATLTDSGVRTDAWALTATGPVAASSLAGLIRADPAHRLADVARAVLERVALAETAADPPAELAAAIGRDGTFRIGVITGRAPGTDDHGAAPPSRYVGARQRRAAALAEAERLETFGNDLDGQAAAEEATASRLRREADEVRARARSFPATTLLATAERDRASAAYVAGQARGRAEESAARAEAARAHARALSDAWRDQVLAMSLPAEPDQLAAAREAAASAGRGLRDAATAMDRHHATLLRLNARLATTAEDRSRLAGLHTAASTAYTEARRARLEYERLEAAYGRDAAELASRLSDAERREVDAREDVAAGRLLRDEAVVAESRAGVEARHAAESADAKQPAASAALDALRRLVTVPDVADAILRDVEPAEGAALIRQVREAVQDVTTWSKRKVAETYETARAQLAGVWAVDRTDGYGDQLDTYQCTYDGTVLTPAASGRLARELADRAARQLHEREEAALRDFIVGRLPAAIGTAWTEQGDWVTDVNRKMGAASASSGVGVRVRTTLRDDLTVTQRTVYRLACKKSAATRTPDDDAELAEALKSLLAVATGDTITDRVRDAVYIREWARVDYLVHRPGQEPKRWTRNTGLSGGERRLVILAPMLASIAALYDNLPGTALRLAALDEVPAEVDERGREGLARYLAELDLDVICTSYLWDGAPGAWDGVDAHDLEVAPDGIVVAFRMLVRGLDALPGDPDEAW